jgi:hypothetical protein
MCPAHRYVVGDDANPSLDVRVPAVVETEHRRARRHEAVRSSLIHADLVVEAGRQLAVGGFSATLEVDYPDAALAPLIGAGQGGVGILLVERNGVGQGAGIQPFVDGFEPGLAFMPVFQGMLKRRGDLRDEGGAGQGPIHHDEAAVAPARLQRGYLHPNNGPSCRGSSTVS